MHTRFLSGLLLVLLSCFMIAVAQDGGRDGVPPQGGDFSNNPQATKVPQGVILLNGALPSATDSVTPVPEGGRMQEKAYVNSYFGMTYPLPAGWRRKYLGPPPSDSGYYVLTQIEPAKTFKGPAPGTILFSAQDLFFPLAPVNSAMSLINFKRDRLGGDLKVERQPAEVKINGRTFVRMDYMSPVAELHWHILATQVRCHIVEFMFTSRDEALLEGLVQSLDNLRLLAEEKAGHGGGESPVCVKDYVSSSTVINRVEPVFRDRTFNAVPVRLVIDKYGRVKHIHVISSFPEQSKAVTEALLQWEFRPYRVNGQAVEVETGIMFGAAPTPLKPVPGRTTTASD